MVSHCAVELREENKKRRVKYRSVPMIHMIVCGSRRHVLAQQAVSEAAEASSRLGWTGAAERRSAGCLRGAACRLNLDDWDRRGRAQRSLRG
jgi:hypothetical protein